MCVCVLHTKLDNYVQTNIKKNISEQCQPMPVLKLITLEQFIAKHACTVIKSLFFVYIFCLHHSCQLIFAKMSTATYFTAKRAKNAHSFCDYVFMIVPVNFVEPSKLDKLCKLGSFMP